MTAPTATPPDIGRLARLRLLQPVRFYTWPALAFLVLLLLIAAAATGEWAVFGLVQLPGVLLVGIAGEAARRSVLTVPEALRAMRDLPR